MRISDWSSDVCSSDLAIYLTTWLTYRASKRLVTPVTWLARQVVRWDPSNPDVQSIAPERMPGESGGEVHQLTGALRNLTRRTREDRKSTRLNSVTNAHLVCRLLLEKKQFTAKHT